MIPPLPGLLQRGQLLPLRRTIVVKRQMNLWLATPPRPQKRQLASTAASQSLTSRNLLRRLPILPGQERVQLMAAEEVGQVSESPPSVTAQDSSTLRVELIYLPSRRVPRMTDIEWGSRVRRHRVIRILWISGRLILLIERLVISDMRRVSRFHTGAIWRSRTDGS